MKFSFFWNAYFVQIDCKTSATETGKQNTSASSMFDTLSLSYCFVDVLIGLCLYLNTHCAKYCKCLEIVIVESNDYVLKKCFVILRYFLAMLFIIPAISCIKPRRIKTFSSSPPKLTIYSLRTQRWFLVVEQLYKHRCLSVYLSQIFKSSKWNLYSRE